MVGVGKKKDDDGQTIPIIHKDINQINNYAGVRIAAIITTNFPLMLS